VIPSERREELILIMWLQIVRSAKPLLLQGSPVVQQIVAANFIEPAGGKAGSENSDDAIARGARLCQPRTTDFGKIRLDCKPEAQPTDWLRSGFFDGTPRPLRRPYGQNEAGRDEQ
jgi:hypothetical protein